MGVAYDQAHDVVVLFGGTNGQSYLGDTWTWDGVDWTEQHPATSPPAGLGMGMAYDAARGQVVMFGGEGNTNTWTWDGVDWTLQQPRNTPAWRERPGFAYDSVRQQVVMFGGFYFCFEDDCYLHDTWVWDGSTWRWQDPATVPSAAAMMGMAFDQSAGLTVMFGGSSCCHFRNKTWTWDGTDWVLYTPTDRPERREAMGLTWDPSRGQILLFGGRNADAPGGSYHDFVDTWAWDGSTWTCVSACP